MDMKDYQPAALSTCVLRGGKIDLEHAVLGLITESGEFADAFKREHVYEKKMDVVNIKEEVGDDLWYAALLAQLRGYDLGRDRRALVLEDDGAPLSVFDLTVALCGTAAAMAACISMGEQHYGDLEEQFDLHMGALQLVCDTWSFPIEEAAAINIAKLKKRYPNGFTKEAALNRDLAGERTVLEAGAGVAANLAARQADGNPHTGSTFQSFLDSEGIAAGVDSEAAKRAASAG